jgi:hypothetical protein
MLPSAEATKKVWERFGIGDRMGWSIVGGHGHCQLPERQWPEVQAFIDRFLLDRPADTSNIQIAEFSVLTFSYTHISDCASFTSNVEDVLFVHTTLLHRQSWNSSVQEVVHKLGTIIHKFGIIIRKL